jgi:hypothetical protein
MADIKLAMQIDSENPNIGDLYLENGTLRLTNSLQEEAIQRIRVSMLLFKGEWFLDETQGVPYWQNILGQKISLMQLQRIFRSVVQQQPTVASISRFSVKPLPSRAIQIEFTCKLVDGVTLVSSDYAPIVIGA